jgi:putative peptide zinc metalloprotease protein
MAHSFSFFSEHWHRVAQASVELKPHITIHKQIYRGETWYVLRDPLNNRFFRLREESYRLVVQLRHSRTVEAVWKEEVAKGGEAVPGQEELIHLLGQLYQSNLLVADLAPDAIQLFENYKKSQQKEIQSKLQSFLTPRFHLFDPDPFLSRLAWAGRLLFSWPVFFLWLAVVAWAIKLGWENQESLGDRIQGTLGPGNLGLLYVASLFSRLWHELGHGLACRGKGGEVHSFGLFLLVFIPLPFLDTTSSYGFRKKADRIQVSGAGMLFELFLAAIALIVWANTAPGTLNSLAYNVIFIASVSTLIFNLNPLLRFDGYYIFADLLDIPNLQSRSFEQLRYLSEKYLFGLGKTSPAAHSWSEAGWMVSYGISSLAYRILIIFTITAVVADRFLGIGLGLAIVLLLMWILIPVVKFVRYLLFNRQLRRRRLRAIGSTLAGIGALAYLLILLPVEDTFRAEGIIESNQKTAVFTEVEGIVEEMLVPSASPVSAGQPLVRLRSEELKNRRIILEAKLMELEHRTNLAAQENSGFLSVIRGQIRSVEEALAILDRREADLEVRAPRDGIWICFEDKNLKGRWLTRGAELGEVFEPSSFRFVGVVPQQEASNLFEGEIRKSEVRLRGRVNSTLPIDKVSLIEAENLVLPSPALGWAAQGKIAISADDQTGMTAAEPFFLVVGEFSERPSGDFLHGRTGQIRFYLPPKSLLEQGYRWMRQIIQKRYQL